VERVISDRLSKDSTGDVVPEDLVKWQGLSYAEATWYEKLNWHFCAFMTSIFPQQFREFISSFV